MYGSAMDRHRDRKDRGWVQVLGTAAGVAYLTTIRSAAMTDRADSELAGSWYGNQRGEEWAKDFLPCARHVICLWLKECWFGGEFRIDRHHYFVDAVENHYTREVRHIFCPRLGRYERTQEE